MSPPVELLTYDDLTEVYRREKNYKTISEVRRDFYPAMRDCLEQLKRESERELAAGPFSTKAKLANNQLMKFQEKAAQVFEFRMGKILDMALRAAEGSRIETSRLTIEEQEIYDKVYAMLKERRSIMLETGRARAADEEEPSLAVTKVPDMVAEARKEGQVYDAPQPAPSVAPYPSTAAPLVEKDVSEPAPVIMRPAQPGTTAPDLPPAVIVPAPPAVPAPSPAENPPPPEYIVLRILEDIPPFAASDRNYRLKKEDLVALPPPIAKALIARKKAVGVQLVPERRP